MYCTKVCRVVLKLNPYVIPEWFDGRIPNVQWSDMFMYMIVTPSAYIKKEIKVSSLRFETRKKIIR